MLKKLLYLVLCFMTLQSASAQSAIDAINSGQDVNVLFKNEANGKLFIHSRGIGASYRRLKHVTDKSKTVLDFELTTLRHPKEVKVTGTAENNRRFVYGKLNSVYCLRAGYGFQHALFKKADKKAIEIRATYLLGITASIAKPYYVQIFRGDAVKGFTQKSVPFNVATFTPDSVIGRGAFSDGLAETRIYPAINARVNLSFEYAPYSYLVRGFELGFSADFYPVALPMMARNPKENLILTVHAGFIFGKRWF
jgi:hypothetical protein